MATKNVKLTPVKLEESAICIVGNKQLLVGRYIPQIGGGSIKPENEWREKLHWFDEKKKIYGFPSSGLKSSWISTTGTYTKATTKVRLRGAIIMLDTIMPMISDPPRRYNSYVRTSQGKMVLSTRGEFYPWRILVRFKYVPSVLSPEMILNIASWAGVVMGLGARSPKCGQTYGTYDVVSAEEFGELP